MQVILPNDQTLVEEHEMLVQHPRTVRWATAEQAASAVEPLPQRPSLDVWTQWVERAGGQWAADADLAHL